MFYLFYPHGSRKISDLQLLRNYSLDQVLTLPRVICHDQETLRYNDYTDDKSEMLEHRAFIDKDKYRSCQPGTGLDKWLWIDNNNLNLATYFTGGISIYDRTVLLHSEINSNDLMLYEQQGYTGAYWWSHALIARDWYRYAQYDHRLKTHLPLKQPFLIYSRGFTREREYRLKFIELLHAQNLLNKCNISLLHNEDGVSVFDYKFTNDQLTVPNPGIFADIRQNHTQSTASADYSVDDIITSAINVVLETQFTGSKLHLTEKILRPLACAQPFILAAGPGALSILRHYGFETYEGLIDESYDRIQDPVARLEAIVNAMKNLSTQTSSQWQNWRTAAMSIALRNQERFFSSAFTNQIITELFGNLNSALQSVQVTRGINWRRNRLAIRHNQPNHWQYHLKRKNDRIKATKLRQLRSHVR